MKKLIRKVVLFIMVVSSVMTLGFEWVSARVEAASEIYINLYGQRAANHCAEAALACVEAHRLGLNEQDNPAIYWACWAVTTGGALMPGDGFRSVGKNASAICKEIDAGNPVLLYFSNFGNPGNYHWVVAYGYDGNGSNFEKIKIMCPAHNGSTPTAWYTTLAGAGCTVSNLCNAKVVEGGFIQSVNGNTVVADGVFTNVKVTDYSDNDAAIQCTLRYTGDGGHDCNDFGFYISTNPDMSGATMHRESDLNSAYRNRNGVYADVKIPYYKMSKWHKSFNSSTKHYFQFFIEKNGILIKSKVYPLESGNPKPVEGDVTVPVVSSAHITSVYDDHYNVRVQASDNVGVARVSFPSWTSYRDQDDIADEWWNNPSVITTECVNGYYSKDIYFSDHNHETGTYNTHVYVYDAAGNYVCGANLLFDRYVLSKRSFDLTKGDCKVLGFTPSLGSGVGVTYESSNSNVAIVNPKGVITAVGEGSCTITAKLVLPQDNSIDYRLTANVSVKEIHIKSISIPSSLELDKGKTASLSVTYNPTETTDSKSVTWSSSDSKVATVDNNGKVTAVSPGSAVITATASGKKSSTCVVTVKGKADTGTNTNTGTNTGKNTDMASNLGDGNKTTTDEKSNTDISTSNNTDKKNENTQTEGVSPMIISGKDLSWNEVGGKAYWYENGYKQGTYSDPKGVMGEGTVRGREIYDNSVKDENGNGSWYWLDAAYDGAKAVNKEVWMPYIYQDEDSFTITQKTNIAAESDGGMSGLGNCVLNAMTNKTGKWVRYDSEGRMMKGWVTIQGQLANYYPDQIGNTYYYDFKTGLMAKGWVTISGQSYHFDEITGVLSK